MGEYKCHAIVNAGTYVVRKSEGSIGKGDPVSFFRPTLQKHHRGIFHRRRWRGPFESHIRSRHLLQAREHEPPLRIRKRCAVTVGGAEGDQIVPPKPGSEQNAIDHRIFGSRIGIERHLFARFNEIVHHELRGYKFCVAFSKECSIFI